MSGNPIAQRREVHFGKEAKSLMPSVTLPAVGLWMGIASLVFGVIVMLFPKILNYLVGIYLIIIGVMALIAYFNR